MWDYDGLLAKARLYFQRAVLHPNIDDDEFKLWLSLGFEFLLRCPLAAVHPSLLAASDNESILNSNGIPRRRPRDANQPGSGPKTVATTVVLDRLCDIVNDFIELRKDAEYIVNVRNAELHSADAALANATTAIWLPRFIRVVDVLVDHLGLSVDDLLSADLVAQARVLTDQEDKKVQANVAKAISDATAFFVRLSSEEVDARKPSWPAFFPPTDDEERVACPACQQDISMPLTAIRIGNERFEDDVVVTETVWIADHLECPVCGLVLDGTAEIRAADLQQQYVKTSTQSLTERFDVYDPSIDYDDAYGDE